MTMRLALCLIAAALAACTTTPELEGSGALTLWPSETARPNKETSITGLTHDTEAQWLEDTLTLGEKRRITLSTNAGGDLVYQWQNTWWSGLRFDRSTPVDLQPFREQGGIVLTARFEQFENAGFDIARQCGGGCERKVTVTHSVAELKGLGWQTLKLPAHCVIRGGDGNLWSKTPLRLSSGGTGKAVFKRIEWRRDLSQVDGITLPCPDPKMVTVTPEPLNEHWAISWWKPRHQEKLELARNSDPKVVFIGDSITQGWEDSGAPVWEQHFAEWQPLNLGFSGDRTENVLWRLHHGEVDDIDPEVAVVMIGTNNTGHRQDAPEQIAKGVDAILDELKNRLPDTRILLLAIFPRGETPEDYLRQNNTLTNARLRNLADGEQLVFVDLNRVFLDRQGTLPKTLMPDLLHPNEEGYRLLAEALKPAIERLMPAE